MGLDLQNHFACWVIFVVYRIIFVMRVVSAGEKRLPLVRRKIGSAKRHPSFLARMMSGASLTQPTHLFISIYAVLLIDVNWH
jgi:hypothetical protein